MRGMGVLVGLAAVVAACCAVAGPAPAAWAFPPKPGPNIVRVTYRGSIHMEGRPRVRIRAGLNQDDEIRFFFYFRTAVVQVPCKDGSTRKLQFRARSIPFRLSPGGSFWGGSFGGRGSEIEFGGRIRPRKARGTIAFTTGSGCKTGELDWRARPASERQ